MKYGAVIFQTDYAIRPEEIARAAADELLGAHGDGQPATDRRGYDSGSAWRSVSRAAVRAACSVARCSATCASRSTARACSAWHKA